MGLPQELNDMIWAPTRPRRFVRASRATPLEGSAGSIRRSENILFTYGPSVIVHVCRDSRATAGSLCSLDKESNANGPTTWFDPALDILSIGQNAFDGLLSRLTSIWLKVRSVVVETPLGHGYRDFVARIRKIPDIRTISDEKIRDHEGDDLDDVQPHLIPYRLLQLLQQADRLPHSRTINLFPALHCRKEYYIDPCQWPPNIMAAIFGSDSVRLIDLRNKDEVSRAKRVLWSHPATYKLASGLKEASELVDDQKNSYRKRVMGLSKTTWLQSCHRRDIDAGLPTAEPDERGHWDEEGAWAKEKLDTMPDIRPVLQLVNLDKPWLLRHS
ncbi:Uu.00g144190.m01.CDS01 [Anthostomella pinea]|uniref:Uu.00g144190.m01.CDS01 n=1 Tax=Anthostomella pinea TaxID=933095 RepID=A0AAI8YLM0_9PEZI|nr:Uu.00g144190.m01.CDS01 [Anthostomella pinea]